MQFYKNLAALLLLLVGVCSANASNEIAVQKGILDLRGVDLNKTKELAFTGDWEFYWNALYETNDFSTKQIAPDLYIPVPSVWNSISINGEKLPEKGYATYRVKILVDELKPMAFKIGSIGTAFNLFVDGRLIYSAGKVSKNENNAQPGYNPGIVLFTPKSNIVEVIFHVSNYHYCKAGMWNGYNKIGLGKHVYKSWERSNQLSILLIGSILIFALYHLGLYFLNRNFRYTLYFSLFCVIIVIRTLVTNEMFLLELIPDFNFEALIKIEYFTVLAGTAAFSLFIYKFFTEEYSIKFLKLILATSGTFSLVILATPTIFFTKYLLWYQLNILLAAGYIIYVVIRALSNKRQGAFILLLGFLILMAAVVNDILYTLKIINTAFLTSFGFILFVFSQAHMLAMRFSSLFVKTESLAQRLEATNENLEKLVEKRTAKIQEQNGLLVEKTNEIQHKNKELEQVNDEIMAQRDNLQRQNEIVNQQKKQITSSIEYASRIQNAVLNTANEIEKVAPDSFVLFHPKDIVSGDFYWFKQIEIEGKKYKIATVVDCTGHGVPGAFMSILGALFLSKIVGELKTNPEAAIILNNMRSEVKNVLQQTSSSKLVKDGMDMALIILDYEKKELQYAGAHNPLWIIRNENGKPAEEIEEVRGDKMPIGTYVKERDSFTNHKMQIADGDLIYLFSDGYHDQFGGDKGTKLMRKVFKQILLKNAHLPLSRQKLVLDHEFFKWRGNYDQIDDITVVGIRI